MAREEEQGVRIVLVQDKDGQQLERFKFGMTAIRSVKGMLQGLWSLNPFSEGLSGRNGFSDVDGHTEIDGRGLVLEFKQSLRGVNKGQIMKAVRQAKFQKTCTWFIEGDTDNPKRMMEINETGIDGEHVVSEIYDVDMVWIKARIKAWEKWSRQNSLVKGNKTVEWDEVNRIINKCRGVEG